MAQGSLGVTMAYAIRSLRTGLLPGVFLLTAVMTLPAAAMQNLPDGSGGAVPPTNAGDTLVGPAAQLADTLVFDDGQGSSDEDEVEVRNPPIPAELVPVGWTTGVWEWDREALQSTRSLTLLELMEEIPGVTALRGGDYGQPATVTAFGLGGGRVRVFLDGVELPPLEGSVVDLSRVGLGGVDRVRVQRRPGELRVDLTPLRLFEPRPYTLLEVGTGDLNTNLFRGTFAHPDALGGNLVVSLDRIDTEGPFRNEPGASFGAHIRHNLFRAGGSALAWEFRTMTARRPPTLWSPRNVSRSDLSLHLRHELDAGILLGAYAQRSWLGVDYGRGVAPPAQPEVNEEARNQFGARASLDREQWWGEVGGRIGTGEGWPSHVLDARGGGHIEGLGGAAVALERQAWDGAGSATGIHARIWTEPRLGFSLFGEVEQGTRGVPYRILPEPSIPPASEDPLLFDGILPGTVPSRQVGNGNGNGNAEEDAEFVASLADRTGFRAGIEYRWNDLHLGGAVLRASADSLHPAGFLPDMGGIVTTGPARNGVEGTATLPLTRLLSGLQLTGSMQLWDEEGDWRYLPRRSYEGRFRFHDLFLESGNLEVWGDVGVRGRAGMSLPLLDGPGGPALQSVGSSQTWFARVQVRVVTVRVFVMWDNFTIRDRNQDFPGRVLPATRALYGIRWTLWN